MPYGAHEEMHHPRPAFFSPRRLAPILAAALLAGCAAFAPAPEPTVEATPPGPPEPTLATFLVHHPERNASAGNKVAFPVTVACPSAVANVTLRAEATGVARGEAQAACGALTFLVLDVDPAAPAGLRALTLEAHAEGDLLGRNRTVASLRILPPAPGFRPGDAGRVVMTGWLDDGQVFYSNDVALADAAFARHEGFRMGAEPLPVVTNPQPSLVAGLYHGVLGLQPGESRTVVVPPALGFGEGTILEREPREETLPRETLLPVVTKSASRAQLDAYLRETGQGDVDSMRLGDRFFAEEDGNRWPYVLTARDAETVEFVLDLREGERYTLYPAWPNATEVLAVSETEAALRTTPTTSAGEAFTHRSVWPNATALVRVNETSIVLRHSPPVGLTYTTLEGEGVEIRVHEVTADHVVLARANPHPLAGRVLTADLTLVELTRG